MKPIVIYLQSDKIQLTKEEFEKYLQQAYDEGYEDGRKDARARVNDKVELYPLMAQPSWLGIEKDITYTSTIGGAHND